MKNKKGLLLISIGFILMFSCDSYDTTVTNTVHADGSITRKVVMRTDNNGEFDPGQYQVPVDSSWATEITMEIDEENDTVWILTAEKFYESTAGLNESYQADSGVNKLMRRHSSFSKSYRWFTTVFRFSETIEAALEIECPVSDFLTEEELAFFYLPHSIQKMVEEGPDSLETRDLLSSLENNSEDWYMTCLVRNGLANFYELLSEYPNVDHDREDIMSLEPQILALLEEEKDEDTVFITVFGEEFYSAYKHVIDSALNKLEEDWTPSFQADNYDVKTRMPGKVISTNGYIMSEATESAEEEILWTVSGEYFLSEDYEMWVESRINNYYAWVVSIMFVIFGITGFIIYYRKR